jgi:hypothetical protein
MLDDYLDLKKENLYQRELELFVKNDWNKLILA